MTGAGRPLAQHDSAHHQTKHGGRKHLQEVSVQASGLAGPWYVVCWSGKNMGFSQTDVPRNSLGKALWVSAQRPSSFLLSPGIPLLPGRAGCCGSRVWAQLVQNQPSNLPVISLKGARGPIWVKEIGSWKLLGKVFLDLLEEV